MAEVIQLPRKKKKIRKREVARFDSTFLIIVLALLAFGLVMLFSASYANAYYYQGNSFEYIGKQAVIGAGGIVAMLIISRYDYHKLKKWAIPFFLLCLALLVAVLFTSGDENGIKRWIGVGSFQFQPSELMKFGLILLFSALMAANHKKMKTFLHGVVPYVLLLGIVVVLLGMEPHLSCIVLMCGIAGILMFVGGTKTRYFVALAILAVGGLLYILLNKDNYQADRFYYWLHPFSDPLDQTLQTDQSLLAIGSGGIMGLGLGNSKQKYMYLPEPQNDFIFAIICEELGVIGAIIVILLFVLFIYKGFTIASKAPDRFGMLLCVGITAQIGIQALLNIAVVTNTIPNTGISLPFFSYGGTALAMQLAEMGVILNISRHALMEKT